MKRVLIAWAVVAGAGSVGLCYGQWKPEKWRSCRPEELATVLVLGVTAGIAAWYAEATHRMAKGTIAMASAAVRPQLVIQGSMGGVKIHSAYIHNRGPGAARQVRVVAHHSHPERPEEVLCDGVELPVEESYCVLYDVAPYEFLAVTWTDCLGKSYLSRWQRMGKNEWVPWDGAL